MKKLLLVAAITAIVQITNAQYFNQTFSSSNNVSSYVSATPNSGQFTFIGSTGGGSTSINQGALRLQRTGNSGTAGACRNFDFNGNPETMAFAFDFSATGNPHANQNDLIIQMGEGFDNNINVEANSKVYAQLGISFPGSSGQFRISNITGNNHNTTNFSGTQRITWVLNRKNESISYTGPNNANVSLGANKADIWVGNTRVYNNVNVQTSGKKMLNFKIIFNPSQNCHVHLDNFGTLTANNTIPPGSYSIGSSSDFTSLTNADGLFQSLNTQGSISGNYFFRIESNLNNESGTHHLGYLIGMDDYNIIITPKDANNYNVISSGSANTGGMIFMNGSRNVIIDGRAPGDLTVRNQNTNGPTITLQHGASNNTIKFCNIEGRTNSTAHGVVFIGPSSADKPGSNGNLLYYNHIRNSNATPRHLIFLNGTTTAINENIKIEKNHIYNAFITSSSSQALVLQNHLKNITIDANHFYQSVDLAYGNSATYLHIIGAGRIGAASTNVDSLFITNNFIGGKAPNCGGDAWLLAVNGNNPIRIRAIDIRIPNNAYALVEGNIINNFQLNFNRTTSVSEFSFRGILVLTGNVDVKNNTIGIDKKLNFTNWTNNTAGIIPVRGIEYSGTGKYLMNNIISGFQGNPSAGTFGLDFTGILINHAGDSLYVSGNTVGKVGETEDFRIDYATTRNLMKGIQNLTSANNKKIIIENNIIEGLANFSSANLSSVQGIISSSPSRIHIKNNQIRNLTSNSSIDYTSSTAAISGISMTSSAQKAEIHNNVLGNFQVINWDNNLTLSEGIYVQGSDTILISNNRIYGLRNNNQSTNENAQAGSVGIRVGNTSVTGATIFNNMISLGWEANGTNIDRPNPFIGIWDFSTTATSKTRIYYNTVLINGNTWATNLHGFAILKGRYDNTLSSGLFQAANNILVNRRSGNIANAAIGYINAASNKNLINNNILFSSASDKATMNGMGTFLTFAGWQGLNMDLFSSFENLAQPSALMACGTSSFADIKTADLHLPNCEGRINAKGMIPSAPVSMMYDIDGEFRRATDIGADEVDNILTFVGRTSTDWNNANNWDLKFIPSCADSVIIRKNGQTVSTPAGNVSVARQPALASSHKAYFKSINVLNGATLTLANQSLIQGCWYDGTVTIDGTVVNNGSIFEMAGSMTLNGTMTNNAGTLRFNIDNVEEFGSNPGLNSYILSFNEPQRIINIDGNSDLHTHCFEVINQAKYKFNGPSSRRFSSKNTGTGLVNHESEVVMNGHTFTINGIMQEGTGMFVGDNEARLIVSGSNDLVGTLSFKEGAQMLKTLEVNRNNGLIKLGTNLTILDTLKLVKGNLETTNDAIVILPLENKLVGTVNNTNCIYGPVKKYLNGNGEKYTFPVGRAGRYRAASVVPQNNGDVAFTVRYFDKSAGQNYDLSSKTTEFESISNKEYWMIDREGTVDAKVELTWDQHSEIDASYFGLAQLQVMKWDSDQGMWITTGPNYGDASGTSTSGVVMSDLITSFSPFTFGKYNLDALPVELLSFTAEPVGDDVLLKWTTASETNNDYFSVLRSTDASNFVEIGTVDGNGNSNRIIDYQFVDPFAAKLNFPILYYRLKQVDFNGQSELHEIAPVKFNSDGSFQIIHASFMNGTNTIESSYTSPENGSGEVFCFDINGRLMGQTRINARKGTNRFEMPLNGNLTSGIYTLQIIMNNNAVAVKIPKADR